MASSILQGTTPTLRISIKPEDLLLSDAAEFELAFLEQASEPTKHVCGSRAIIKHRSDLTVDTDNNRIEYHFSEKETMKLDPNLYLFYQLRIKMNNGEIFGTAAKKISVSDLISQEMMP